MSTWLETWYLVQFHATLMEYKFWYAAMNQNNIHLELCIIVIVECTIDDNKAI
jgi:hypothetical protein